MVAAVHVLQIPNLEPPTWRCTSHPTDLVFATFAEGLQHETSAHPPGTMNAYEYSREWDAFYAEFLRTAIGVHPDALGRPGFFRRGPNPMLERIRADARVAFADYLRLKFPTPPLRVEVH